MTLKSIPALLNELEKKRKLWRFVPKVRKGAQRRLYLSEHAEKQRTDLHSATNILCGKSYVDAALVRWAGGGRVYADDNGKPRFLKELDPPPVSDLWEIRVVEPVVQGRLLGAFIECDTLILMTFHTRNLLKDRDMDGWNKAMAECEAQWTDIFPSVPRLHAPTILKYVSENVDVFPLHR